MTDYLHEIARGFRFFGFPWATVGSIDDTVFGATDRSCFFGS